MQIKNKSFLLAHDEVILDINNNQICKRTVRKEIDIV